jgi:hypothetical protein
MGIYSDGKIYGVSLILNGKIIFEKTFEVVMDGFAIEIVKKEYNRLTNDEKNDLSIRFYTSCSSTYDTNNNIFTMWIPSNKNTLEKFIFGKDR